MFKQAFRSYIASLHPRNIKKAKESPNAFWLYRVPKCCLIALLIDICVRVRFELSISQILIIKTIPVLLMYWSNLSSKCLMTKTMFLCPMKYEDRRKYIKYVLILKMLIPAIIGVMIECIWSLHFYELDIIRVGIMSFIYISLGIAIHVCMEALDESGEKVSARKDKSGKTKWAWMNNVSLIYGTFMIILFEIINLDVEWNMLNKFVIGVGLVLLLVLDGIILFTQYNDMVEQSTDYELTFQIPGGAKPIIRE